MTSKLSEDEIKFLLDEIGLNKASIQLGIKLSIREKTSFPMALWSYGLITNSELDMIYKFLYQTT